MNTVTARQRKQVMVSGCCGAEDRAYGVGEYYAADLGRCPDCGAPTTFIDMPEDAAGTPDSFDKWMLEVEADERAFRAAEIHERFKDLTYLAVVISFGSFVLGFLAAVAAATGGR